MICKKLFLVTCLVLWVGVSSVPRVTEMTKKGVCPKSPLVVSCDRSCSNDNECPENMKCCDTRCGLQCVYAERPGFCPLNDLPHEVGIKTKPKCFSDFDCWKNAKCCKRGSSQDCLPPLKEKPGKCPDFCHLKSALKCSTDRDCPANLKCCPQCGHTCVVPVKVMYAVTSK